MMHNLLNRIAPYNLWGGTKLPTGYPRTGYLDKLKKYTGNRLIKVLTGQRRVGKSYIMRQLAMSLVANGVSPENTLFINRELAVFDFLQNSDDLNQLVSIFREDVAPDGKIYLFIDEVQEISGWEKAINSLSQDYTFEAEIFLSGSNSRLLSGELATLLSGRYIQLTIYPLAFTEYTGFHQLERDRSAFLRYLDDGGLPELVNLPDKEVKQRYMEGLRDSVMLKDIVKRYSIKDITLLENIFAYLINTTASMVSITAITNYMKSRGSKTSYDTVATYIGYLQEAFLLHKAIRYNISGKDLLGGNFKAYPNDQAYQNYLFPTTGFGRGYMLEEVVFMSLLRMGYTVNTGVLHNGEIDFIATSADRTLFIQVAYSVEEPSTAEREYGAFKNLKSEGERILITMDDRQLPIRYGVRHIRAWEMETFVL